MPDLESRQTARRAFDAFSQAFAEEAAARIERGASLAMGDVERLVGLARRLSDNLEAWRRDIEFLEVGLEHPLRPRHAGQLLIDSVFDDALTAPASRVLRAAFDLAASAR